MICPQCIKEGTTSTVVNEGTMTTLMGYIDWYDEQGKYHDHDDNTRTSYCKCSNGHEFEYRQENSCWCGWVGKTEKYTMIDGKKSDN